MRKHLCRRSLKEELETRGKLCLAVVRRMCDALPRRGNDSARPVTDTAVQLAAVLRADDYHGVPPNAPKMDEALDLPPESLSLPSKVWDPFEWPSLDDALPRPTNNNMQQDRVLVPHDQYHLDHDNRQHLYGEDESALRTLARAAEFVGTRERSLQRRKTWEHLTHNDTAASTASQKRGSEWMSSKQPDERPSRIRKLEDEERYAMTDEDWENIWS